MVSPKRLGIGITISALVFFNFAPTVAAEGPAGSAGDNLLAMVPADSLFCVRINNLDQTLGQMDQFLAGLYPTPVSTLVKTGFAKRLGDPALKGVNTNGSFAVFGTITPGEPVGDDIISVLIPVTDYKQFISANPKVSAPDANGVSKITGGDGLVMQVGNFALLKSPKSYDKLIATAKSISAAESAGLASVLDAGQVKQASQSPVWAYVNMQVVSKTFGPMLRGQIEQMKKAIQDAGTKDRTRTDAHDLSECYLADADSDKALTVDELDQQIKKLNTEIDSKQRAIQRGIEQFEQRKSRLAATGPNREEQLHAMEQQIQKLKKMNEDSKSRTQEGVAMLERLKTRLEQMGPDKKVKIPELMRQTEVVKDQPDKTANLQASGSFGRVMDMYAAVLETLMNETQSVSVVVDPKPDVLSVATTVSAVPGTDMAKMFAAGSSATEANRLLAYLEDGAAMNFAGRLNTPFWKALNVKGIDLFAAMMRESMPAEDIAKMKALVEDAMGCFGGPMAGSFLIDAKSKPPFALKYIVAVKDGKTLNKVIDESAQLINTGAVAGFYKDMGFETSFTLKRGQDHYKDIPIDAAQLLMKSTEPNSPQAQMINALYGPGIDYRWATADGLWVCAAGGDSDSAIRKLIDQIKAGEPRQMAGEVKAALALLPAADKADFLATYNILRLLKMIWAFMPMAAVMPQMDIPTKSNMAFAGSVAGGKMTIDVALPKEHLMEIMGVFQKMQQQKIQMQEQKTGGN